MHPEPSTPEPAIPADVAAENLRRNNDLLQDLIERGHGLAVLAHQKAIAIAMDGASDRTYLHKTEDLTIQFERAAQTVRRCILLQQTLTEPRPTGYEIALAAQHRQRARDRALAAPNITRDTPPNIPRDTETEKSEREKSERTERAERCERVESADEFRNEFATRPIGDIITEICADLAIAPPTNLGSWSRHTLQAMIEAASPERAAPPAPPAPRFTAQADPPQPDTQAPPHHHGRRYTPRE